MSTHLVGGGWVAEHAATVYGPFVSEATGRARDAGREVPRIVALLVVEPDADPEAKATQFREVLASAGAAEVEPLVVSEGEAFAGPLPADLDGIVVGGGLTPAYAEAIRPLRGDLLGLVGDGVPYLGFSAGAAIAAERAVVGGWRAGDVPVCNPDNGEDLDDLTVVDGLGLVPFAVDVHAAQWGNVTRLLTAVREGLVERGVAVDEDTVLVVGSGRSTVRGAGQVWSAARTGEPRSSVTVDVTGHGTDVADTWVRANPA